MIVVIPTSRSINVDYLRCLLEEGHRCLVVDDTDDGRLQVSSPDIEILRSSDRQRRLGHLASCIPRGNGACRDFGLLVAYWEAAPGDTIVCLDDDCEVFSDYAGTATELLGDRSLPLVRTSHRFYNPLDLYELDLPIYPRGFPYEERGRPIDYDYSGSIDGRVVFHLGLWRGIFDVNAIDKRYLTSFAFDDVRLRQRQTAVQPGALVSLCSMNMIATRDVIPAMYQLPMNEPVASPWTIDRYGDIWGGYICKRMIDRRGDLLSVGEPMIHHHKDGNVERNLLQEHYAHLVNMQFCDLMDDAMDGVQPSDYVTMYDQFVANLESRQRQYPQGLAPYLEPTVRKMRCWVQALRAARPA